ncbi:hypothetical protein Tco_0666818 [Tanacetum coccineum]
MLYGPTAMTVAVRIVPFHPMYPPVAGVASLTEVRIFGLLQRHTKAQFRRQGSRLHTRYKTRNLSLKEIAEAKGPVSIQFDVGDKQTLNPLGPHAAQWSNYIGEVIRSVPLYYPSWEKVPKERKTALISNIEASNHDLPQTSSSQIWISILTIGLILRTLPEPFKILKIRQRARSFAGRDPGHLMSSEICRWRALRLERGDVEAQGSRRQYADGVTTRCPSCLRSFSRNMRSVVAAGGRGEDDEPGTDEDVQPGHSANSLKSIQSEGSILKGFIDELTH